MKSALSLTLIVCLVGSALPAAAQDRFYEPTSGPIARAVTREAVRLAAAQPNEPADPSWSRVRKLKPGTEVTVTVKGTQPGKRYFLGADEAGLTVLNLTEPTLPAAARDTLLELASLNPERFVDAQKGGTFLLHKNVRVVSGDVFVADQKVANLGQVVERIARTDVVEVAIPRRHMSLWAKVAIGVGVAVAVALAWAAVLLRGT